MFAPRKKFTPQKIRAGHRLAAVMMAGMICGISDSAAASGAVNAITLTNNLVTNTGNFVTLLSSFSYIAGISMGVFGVFRLKQHVDNPSGTPMREGMIRLSAGGMLLSMPFMLEIMKNSISQNAGSAFTPTYVNDFGVAAVPVGCSLFPAYCGF